MWNLWHGVAKERICICLFLSCFLFVSYLKYLRTERRNSIYFVWFYFFFHSFPKRWAASLPVALVLTDYFKQGKINVKACIDKIPFLYWQSYLEWWLCMHRSHIMLLQTWRSILLLPRIVFACYGFIDYLFKLILPVGLSAYYPYPVKGGNAVPVLYYFYPLFYWFSQLLFLFSTFLEENYYLVLAFLPHGFPGASNFCLSGDAVMADRYSYVPSIGLFYLAGEGFYWLWSRRKSSMRVPSLIVLIIIASFFSFETYARCEVWRNGMSLWNDFISHYQSNTFGVIVTGGKLLAGRK